MIFRTDRLDFRRLVPEDFDSLYRLYSDPEVRRFFPEGVLDEVQTREELEWFLNGHPHDPRLGLWATTRREDRKFVGRCGLLPWQIDGESEIEIAYMVAPEHWRQGYGAEAAKGLVRHGFTATEATRLIALIDPEHEASIRTATSAGLTYWKHSEVDGFPSSVYRIDRT